MSTLTPQEVSEFRAAVRGDLARVWPSPRVADEPQAGAESLRSVWVVAAAQEWTALGVYDALEAALAATEELGRAACPLPLMDVYVATRLVAGLDDAIVEGSVRPVVAIDRGDRSWRFALTSGGSRGRG